MKERGRGPGASKEPKGRDTGAMDTGAMENEARSIPAAEGVKVDPRIQNEIGKHLRAIYDPVLNEPVPDRFMELLKELERSTARKN